MSEKSGGVAKAAGIIMISMIVSRAVGYLRDVVIAYEFGQTRVTDAYFAAFTIPDYLYALLIGGALSSAFIPVFASYISTDREEEAWETASIVFNLSISLMLVGILFGVVWAPQLVHWIVPGFSPKFAALTVKLTRIMFAQALFMGLAGLSMGILNSYKHFLMPAIGSVLYNLITVVVGWVLAVYFNLGIMGFTLGVVLGAVANFAVQLPKLIQLGLKYRFSFDIHNPGVQKIFALMVPVLIGLSVTQFNVLVNQNLGSRLPPGIVSALKLASRLMQIPISTFGIAVAMAMFPTLTEFAAKNQMHEFKKNMSLAMRSIVFVCLPAAAGLIALRVPIVRVLYQLGQFSDQATSVTAHALLFYSLGMIGYAAQQLLNRTFYALQDTWTPVAVGVLSIAINIVLNFSLIGPMGHGGLALAYSIAGIFMMVALLYLLRRKIGSINGRELLNSVARSLLTSAIMGLLVYFLALYLENTLDMSLKINQIIQVISGIGLGIGVYGAFAMVFKSEEALLAWSFFTRRFHRKGGNSRAS